MVDASFAGLVVQLHGVAEVRVGAVPLVAKRDVQERWAGIPLGAARWSKHRDRPWLLWFTGTSEPVVVDVPADA